MDRAQLKYLLNLGPTRILDVHKLQIEQKLAPLFKVGFFNNAILIKQSGGNDLSDWEELPPIGTKIYLPYDRRKPEDGGDLFFTSTNFRNAVKNSLGEKI